MSRPGGFEQYGRPLRVEGGLRAQSARGAIGETWWSKRFIDVLESFALGSRLGRGRNYARRGQVLSLTIEPGVVRAAVQGSRPKPYDVTITLPVLTEPTWRSVEKALAEQAIFGARLLAGEMPAQIEDLFGAAKAPLFPTTLRQLALRCSCPDGTVPCKHLAATFYLLAEAFDADPFQILHWRGRDRETLLAHLSTLRSTDETPAKRTRKKPVAIGAAVALADLNEQPLAVDRFWVAPVPLPKRPPTLDTDVDLILRQLPAPPGAAGGAELASRLRTLYLGLSELKVPDRDLDLGDRRLE